MSVEQLADSLSCLDVGANQQIVDQLFGNMPESVRASFFQLLNNTDGLITGSFVARLFFPKWTPNDIDVFIPLNRPLSPWKQDLVASGWGFVKDVAVEYEQGYSRGACVYYHPELTLSLNVIFYDADSRAQLLSRMQESFDIDGCAVAFDGQRILLPAMDPKKFMSGHWNIKHLPTCSPATPGVLPMGKWWRNCIRFQNRITKYASRGIVFENAAGVIKTLTDYLGNLNNVVFRNYPVSRLQV